MSRGSPDLALCQICEENMIKKEPRLLSCHHSFCHGCIQGLVTQGSVACPNCFEKTKVENSDVHNLPINIYLLKIWEKESNRLELNSLVCVACTNEAAVVKCETCRKIFCRTCKEKHNRISVYKGHEVFYLCMKHGHIITHVCLKCKQPVCTECMLNDHDEHDDKFIEFREGLNKIRTELTELNDNIKQGADDLQSTADATEEEISATQVLKDDIVKERKFYKEKLTEADALLEKIEKSESIVDHVREAFREGKESCANSSVLMEKVLSESDINIFQHVRDVKEKCEDTMKLIKKALDIKFAPLSSMLVEGWNLHMRQPVKLYKCVRLNEFKGMQIILNLKGTYESGLQEPVEIAALGANSVVVADEDLKCVTRIDQTGKGLAKYYPLIEDEMVNSVTVYDDILYIGQLSGITKIPLTNNTNEPAILLRPKQVNEISKISAVDDGLLILSDSNDKKVYTYNWKTEDCCLILDGLSLPMSLKRVCTNKGIRYFIVQQYAHVVDVYDIKWKLLTSFGGYGSDDGKLSSPNAILETPMGTLMVCDWGNNRISHFTFEGEFLEHVMTIDDGIKYPVGLAYQPPYFWLLENSFNVHKALKCYYKES